MYKLCKHDITFINIPANDMDFAPTCLSLVWFLSTSKLSKCWGIFISEQNENYFIYSQ